jgi:FKBP-type peptidyl-prolyl cis-trans isomerase 2
MAVGERRVLDVASGVPAGLKHEDRFIQMVRVRQRPKFVRMTPEEYKTRTRKDPQVDQPYVIDPVVPGKVASVGEKEVVIQFSAQPGQEVKTPLGKGVIRESEKHWEIVIDSKKGDLVRFGPMVGRIVDVDERMITIDCGHPFGGEALSCEVEVVSIER